MSVKKKGSEKENAVELKRMIYDLGKKLGFFVDTEVNQFTANLYFDKEYVPEVDIVWYFITSQKLNLELIEQTLKEINIKFIQYLPLVGFEIEASDPTSKIQTSNAANLYVQHYPFGFLVIDEEKGKKGLYRRAARILRTFRFQFGQLNYLPLSKGQIFSLLNHDWKEPSNITYSLEQKQYTKGAGGENVKTKIIREKLVKIGEKVGFTVYSDWSPEDLNFEFKLRKSILNSIKNPIKLQKRFLCGEVSSTPSESKLIKRWDRFYIRPKIDVNWCIGLPLRFIEFIEQIMTLDDDFRYNLPIYKKVNGPYPIIGFEIESSVGKHAGGGILNLSRYTHFGFLVVKNKDKEALLRKIKTYSRNLGINNVYPLTFEEIESI